MKNDDYGFYGKGLDGYVHYRQGMHMLVAVDEVRQAAELCCEQIHLAQHGITQLIFRQLAQLAAP